MKKEVRVTLVGLCVIASIMVVSAMSAMELKNNFEKNKELAYNSAGTSGTSEIIEKLLPNSKLKSNIEPKTIVDSAINNNTFPFLKAKLNSSIKIADTILELDANEVQLEAKSVKIKDTNLGYGIETSGKVTLIDFKGKIFKKQGNLNLVGTIKSFKTNKTSMNINNFNEQIIEIEEGKLEILSTYISNFESIASGSIKLDKKFDLNLDNDPIGIKGFEGNFNIDSEGNVDLYGKVDSISIDSQSFMFISK